MESNKQTRSNKKNKKRNWFAYIIVFCSGILITIFITFPLNDHDQKKQDVQNDKIELETSNPVIEKEPYLENPVSISGSWIAQGEKDKKMSYWNFSNNKLLINGVETLDYSVSNTLDSNGYTVITITNNQAIPHALLVKQTDTNLEGITVEGSDYQTYLTNGTVPADYQKIIFQVDSSTTENSVDELTLYNNLPLDIKIKLIASIVDERAMAYNASDTETEFFNVFYNIYDNKLYINVHSGVGVGHPIYLLNYDSETVTPIEGVVNAGAGQYQEINDLDRTPVTKKSLYEKYLTNKSMFDSKNLVPNDQGDSIKQGFEFIKNNLNK